MFTIYLLTNKVNGKKYVGYTLKTIDKRWREHLTFSKKGKKILSCAIRKYGADNFEKEILEIQYDLDEAHEAEKSWISHLNSKTPNGYNCTEGGEGMLGWKPSEAWRKHRSEFLKKNPIHLKYSEKRHQMLKSRTGVNNPNPAKIFTPEQIDHIKKSGLPDRELAKIYGCGKSLINKVKHRD